VNYSQGIGGGQLEYSYCEVVVLTNYEGGDNVDNSIPRHIDLSAHPNGQPPYYAGNPYTVSSWFIVTSSMLGGLSQRDLDVAARFYCNGGSGTGSSYPYWQGDTGYAPWTGKELVSCTPSKPIISIRNFNYDANGLDFDVRITNNYCQDISPTYRMYVDGSLKGTTIVSGNIAPGDRDTFKEAKDHADKKTVGTQMLKYYVYNDQGKCLYGAGSF